jgi:hypothetical protein
MTRTDQLKKRRRSSRVEFVIARIFAKRRSFRTRPYLKRTLAHWRGKQTHLSPATFGKRCRSEFGYLAVFRRGYSVERSEPQSV